MSTALDYAAIAYLTCFAWGCTWHYLRKPLYRWLFAESPADVAMREMIRANQMHMRRNGCRVYGHLPPVTGSTCQRCGATIKDRV